MKFVKTIVLLYLAFLITSCDDEGLEPKSLNQSAELIGTTWVSKYSVMEDPESGMASDIEIHTGNDIDTLIFKEGNVGEHISYDEELVGTGSIGEGKWVTDKFTYTYKSGTKKEGALSYDGEESSPLNNFTWELKGDSLTLTFNLMDEVKVKGIYKPKE